MEISCNSTFFYIIDIRLDEMNKNTKILLVDLCDTFYPCNTTMGFITYVIKRDSLIIRSYYLKIISSIIFKMLKIDIKRLLYLKKLKGKTKKELSYLADSYIETLTPNDEVFQKIKEYQDLEYKVVIVSASLEPIVKSVVSKFGFDGYESTTIDYSNDLCTGRIIKDLLGNKANIVRKIQEVNDRVVFITDNMSDHTCIEYCDKFYAVIPKGKNETFWKRKHVQIIRLG